MLEKSNIDKYLKTSLLNSVIAWRLVSGNNFFPINCPAIKNTLHLVTTVIICFQIINFKAHHGNFCYRTFRRRLSGSNALSYWIVYLLKSTHTKCITSVRYMWFARMGFIISAVLSFSQLFNLKPSQDMQLPITPATATY